MKPKISDIARNLSVSSATVSMALSGKGRVSRETTRKIEAEAKRIGYSPSHTGRALRTGRTNVMGLILPDIASPLFPRMGRDIVRAAEAAGYGVLMADSQDSVRMQEQAMRRLIDFGADGVVIIPRKGTTIAPQNVPVAVIDAPDSPMNVVSADHAEGGAIAIRHLQEMGHRNILCLGETSSSLVQRTRIRGMRLAADRASRLTECWLEDAPDIPAIVGDTITAVATTTDIIALRVLTELSRAGFQVPRDVSLTGFDNLDFGQVITPGLTTIGTSESAIAKSAVAGLIQMIDGKEGVKNTLVPMHLVSRDTVTHAKSGGEC